jgi:beta-lactamase class A
VLCAVAAGAPATVAAPTAAAQLSWVLDASAHPAVPAAQLRAHLAAQFLATVGGPAAFDAVLAKVGHLSLRHLLVSRPDAVAAVVNSSTGAGYLVRLSVDRTGLVNGLLLSLAPARDTPQPTSWAELDRDLAGLGATVSFVAAEVEPGGGCRPAHGLDANAPRPLGSAFKLYVLGALGQAVAEHRAAWNEPLPIHDDWKSLPSGNLQLRPAGTELPLTTYADHMISISDNTAADHLIHRLGRAAVERQLTLFGARQPQLDIPFLTTKAMFELKTNGYPLGADAYLALPASARAAALTTVEELPLPHLTAVWTHPEDIDTIEWFASPMDICRAFAGLQRLDQPQIGHALGINDAGMLDRSQFPVVWFKGGSEPGVLTLNFLARSTAGRTFVTSVLVSDPAVALPEDSVALSLTPVIRGAFALLNNGG